MLGLDCKPVRRPPEKSGKRGSAGRVAVVPVAFGMGASRIARWVDVGAREAGVRDDLAATFLRGKFTGAKAQWALSAEGSSAAQWEAGREVGGGCSVGATPLPPL